MKKITKKEMRVETGQEKNLFFTLVIPNIDQCDDICEFFDILKSGSQESLLKSMDSSFIAEVMKVKDEMQEMEADEDIFKIMEKNPSLLTAMAESKIIDKATQGHSRKEKTKISNLMRAHCVDLKLAKEEIIEEKTELLEVEKTTWDELDQNFARDVLYSAAEVLFDLVEGNSAKAQIKN